MLEVRQGGRSCTILIKEVNFHLCDEFLLEDLGLEEPGQEEEVSGARFWRTTSGIVLDPGPNVMALRPHRGLRIMWDGLVLFREDEEGRTHFELIASAAAA